VAAPASVAPDATVGQYAEVKGELRVPNTVNFGLFPTLDPFAKAIYYQLFLLSHGFKRDTCIIGLAKLVKSPTHVSEEGSRHDSLSGKARTHQKTGVNSWWTVKGQRLSGDASCHRGTRRHRGKSFHGSPSCRGGWPLHVGVNCHQ
jgi:hypothetical protein